MESLIIIITGLIAGFILGKAVSILHYTIKIKQERRKKHDRDRKDAQGNEKGDSGLYPVSPERGTESSVPGSSTDGKSLDKAAKEAIRSRDYVARYCNEIDCIKCCFGDGDGGCSLISGPPCMWAKKGVSENGI